jgi:hypothetical protein
MSANGNGHHWSKFCWRDWQHDRELRSCSLEARGYWMECLAAMHEGTPIGHLTLNGKPMTRREMAVNAGVSLRVSDRNLAELLAKGVASLSETGTIFCRRMVRDAEQSEAGRQAVSKRWDKKDNSKHEPNPNREPNRRPTPDPNTKSLESESELESKTPPVVPPWGDARRANGKQRFRSGALDLMVREGGFDYAH